MKKIILLSLIFITFLFFNRVDALERSELTNLDLTKVMSYSIDSGYRYVEGGTVTDKYIVLLEINNESNNTLMKIIDKDTYKTEKVITDYCFSHANDMTYNKDDNKIVIVSGLGEKRIYVLNASTFKLEKTIITPRVYSSIGYDDIGKNYILRSGKTAYITDRYFNEIDSFKMSKENLTPQGLEVHDGKIYYVCYEAGASTNYQAKYTGVLKPNENVIVVYDLKTKKKVKVYYIPQVTKEGVYPQEIEGISFIGNIPIMWANSNGGISIFKPVINETASKIVLNVSEKYINMDNNSNNTIGIYKNSKLITSSRNYDNRFIFSYIYFDKETTDIYNLKLSSNKYILNTNNLLVRVYYNFYDNKLELVYNDKISFTKMR